MGILCTEGIAMLCPIDDAQLAPGSFNGHQLHRCPKCLGVSLSGTLLREVRAHAALQLHKQADTAGIRPCPADGKAMKPLNYKGVAMCACPQCLRLWLDAGQLAQLLELVEPPKQEDLSKIGLSLPGNSSANGFDGLGDLLEFASEVLDVVWKYHGLTRHESGPNYRSSDPAWRFSTTAYGLTRPPGG
jgi:Zn-finger nucleic acid-binding protein